MSEKNNLRIVFPMWQGGNLPAYKTGSELMAWLAPAPGSHTTTVTIPVHKPEGEAQTENGILGRQHLSAELEAAQAAIAKHKPDTLCVFGGDCLVDLVPFGWLSQKYGEGFGILWLDTHPDVMTPAQHPNAHAHVLGALNGNGDPMLTRHAPRPVPGSKIMIAGLHDPSEYEREFIESRGINTVSPEEMKEGTDRLLAWIEQEKITHLAVHFDLDILDHHKFLSLYFNNPDAQPGAFGAIPKGRLVISDVTKWIHAAGQHASLVGLGITEFLPWDAVALSKMLQELPLTRD